LPHPVLRVSIPDHVIDLERAFAKLIAIQKKTGIRLNLVRELNESDLQQMHLVYAAITSGSYEGGEFSFRLAEPSPKIEPLIGTVVDLRFEGHESVVFQILDKDFDLGP
jgi:hypothetical protein